MCNKWVSSRGQHQRSGFRAPGSRPSRGFFKFSAEKWIQNFRIFRDDFGWKKEKEKNKIRKKFRTGLRKPGLKLAGLKIAGLKKSGLQNRRCRLSIRTVSGIGLKIFGIGLIKSDQVGPSECRVRLGESYCRPLEMRPGLGNGPGDPGFLTRKKI